MMNKFTTLNAALALSALPGFVEPVYAGPVPAEPGPVGPTSGAHLHLGPDASISNPLVANQDYADAVAEALRAHIRQNMTYGDRITLQSFGDGTPRHLKAKRLIITRREQPEKAAAKVAGELKSYPKKGIKDTSTNIMGFVENNRFECSAPGSMVMILSDGIESSQDFDDKDLLAGKKLPPPYGQTLKGCAVVMIGIGRRSDGSRLPRNQIHHLKTIWTDWLKRAGASSVELRVNP